MAINVNASMLTSFSLLKSDSKTMSGSTRSRKGTSDLSSKNKSKSIRTDKPLKKNKRISKNSGKKKAVVPKSKSTLETIISKPEIQQQIVTMAIRYTHLYHIISYIDR